MRRRHCVRLCFRLAMLLFATPTSARSICSSNGPLWAMPFAAECLNADKPAKGDRRLPLPAQEFGATKAPEESHGWILGHGFSVLEDVFW